MFWQNIRTFVQLPDHPVHTKGELEVEAGVLIRQIKIKK
jgi:hypothetical protein